jgi:hypothetical protein
MHLARCSGLELPTYDEADVAWTSSEIKATARSGESTFLRRAYLEYNGPPTDLKTVLALSDLVLDHVCERMGVERVDYTWGFAAVSDTTRKRLGQNYHNDHVLLPACLGLVARVENVTDARPIKPNSYWDDRIQSWNPSTMGITTENGHSVTNCDLRSEQFVLRPQDQGVHLDTAVIVDVEPRLRVDR